MGEKELIFTISGIRGIVGENLNPDIVKKIALAYGLWLKDDDKKVIIGRDTRPSGENLEKAIIEGLTNANCRIINLGVCPTPIIIYTKNKSKVPGGIIISGSHNPPEWNGIKLLSAKTFLNDLEVKEISKILYNDQLNQYFQKKLSHPKLTNDLNATNDYIKDLTNLIDFKRIRRNNNLRVVLDTGAGAGKIVTPKILQKLGCNTKLINNEFKKNKFPREIEPIEKNLKDIIQTLKEEKYDLGFAQDCDADRIAIIGNDGTCYPEDIGLALIADYYFKKYHQEGKRIIFVTNLASSLVFEAIASKYDAQVIRTPVGERNLADKMEDLILKEGSSSKIIGGEGSCGGVMIPQFNNTRDGIFAAAKIVEILVEAKEKISILVSRLPKFYAFRENISIKNINLEKFIDQLKESLTSEGENVAQIGMDLRFSQENDWFVLVHPSNTEPIVRIISEAKSESLAISNLKKTTKQIKLVIT